MLSSIDSASSATRSVGTSARKNKQKISIIQTYPLVRSARGKLSKAASHSDNDLRILVGLANLLSSLMIDLTSAELEQERFFDESASGAEASEEEKPTFHGAETIVKKPKADWEEQPTESIKDDTGYNEGGETSKVSAATVITTTEVESD